VPPLRKLPASIKHLTQRRLSAQKRAFAKGGFWVAIHDAPTCRAQSHHSALRLISASGNDLSGFASASGSAVMSTIRRAVVLNVMTLTGLANRTGPIAMLLRAGVLSGLWTLVAAASVGNTSSRGVAAAGLC